MNRNFTTAASATLGTGSYESPTVSVVEIFTEGVLCESETGSDLNVPDWENGDFNWQ